MILASRLHGLGDQTLANGLATLKSRVKMKGTSQDWIFTENVKHLWLLIQIYT